VKDDVLSPACHSSLALLMNQTISKHVGSALAPDQMQNDIVEVRRKRRPYIVARSFCHHARARVAASHNDKPKIG
jgi:hypothetical protein